MKYKEAKLIPPEWSFKPKGKNAWIYLKQSRDKQNSDKWTASREQGYIYFWIDKIFIIYNCKISQYFKEHFTK